MNTIVVGVDGSDGSIRALTFALSMARIRDADIRAVCAWHVPPIVAQTDDIPPGVDESVFLVRAAQTIDHALAESGALTAGVSIHRIAREGSPAAVLCEEAQGAELLVVGSRGLGGFKRLLFGSVGSQVTQHAPCPVVIVPSGWAGAEPAGAIDSVVEAKDRRRDERTVKPQQRSEASPIEPPPVPARL